MPSRRSEAVVVLGGSFAPLHAGHLAALEAGRRDAEKSGYTVVAGYLACATDGHVRAKLAGRGEDASGAPGVEERLHMCNAVAQASGWIRPVPCAYGSAKQCGREMIAAHHHPSTVVKVITGSMLARLSTSRRGQVLSSTFVRGQMRLGGVAAIRGLAADGVLPPEVASWLALRLASALVEPAQLRRRPTASAESAMEAPAAAPEVAAAACVGATWSAPRAVGAPRASAPGLAAAQVSRHEAMREQREIERARGASLEREGEQMALDEHEMRRIGATKG